MADHSHLGHNLFEQNVDASQVYHIQTLKSSLFKEEQSFLVLVAETDCSVGSATVLLKLGQR